MPPPPDPVPKEEEWGSVYDLVANGRGTIDISEVASIMRALAYPQTALQVALFKSEFAYSTGRVKREDFLKIMKRIDKEEALRVQVSQALRLFDPDGNGFLSAAALRRKLTSTGDTPLSDKDVDALFAELPVTVEGEIPTTEILKVLMTKPKILFSSVLTSYLTF